MFDRLRYEPRRLAVAVGGLVAMLVVALIVAVALHVSGGSSATAAADRTSGPTGQPTAGTPTAGRSATSVEPSGSPATDVAQWNAMPAVAPVTSSNYPAIPAAGSTNPDSYAKVFATELFTRDYRTATRAQLIAWAQWEDSPLRSPNYPQADWSKVLVDSLTDLTWDDASETPIPADGPWLALRSESARDTVSDVRAELDPQWEQQIAAGYQPPDGLATVRDVSLTVTRHVVVAGRPSVSRFAVSLAVQLGTAARGAGYGVAATNNYVARQVS
jgi:hypothetical protein